MNTHVQQQIRVLEVGFHDHVSNSDLHEYDELHVVHGSQRSIYSIRNTIKTNLIDTSLVEISKIEEADVSLDQRSE